MKNDKKYYCGPKGWIIKPPFHAFFEASCKKHDEGYLKGGDEARRIECDIKFYAMMMKDIYRHQKAHQRAILSTWALIYFIAVRLFGAKFFNYGGNGKTIKSRDCQLCITRY
jgi:hypothetical protein